MTKKKPIGNKKLTEALGKVDKETAKAFMGLFAMAEKDKTLLELIQKHENLNDFLDAADKIYFTKEELEKRKK